MGEKGEGSGGKGEGSGGKGGGNWEWGTPLSTPSTMNIEVGMTRLTTDPRDPER